MKIFVHSLYNKLAMIHSRETSTWTRLALLKLTQSCLTLGNPVDCSPPGSSVHEIFRQEYWSGLPFPPPGIPDPGIKATSSALPGRFLTTELPGKPKELVHTLYKGHSKINKQLTQLKSWSYIFLEKKYIWYIIILKDAWHHYSLMKCKPKHTD